MNRTYRDVLDAAARPYVPDELDLFPRIAARLERRSFMQTLRARPALAILIVLVALSLLTGIAYAVGRSLGYIPGVGIIEQGAPIRVLAEPVSVERDGIKLTVTDAVLTADKTVIVYTLENVPWSALSHHEDVLGCHEMPFLHLPNGDLLFFGEGGGSLQQMRLVYSSIPADINRANFMLPCIMETLPGLAPENWELSLHFVPAPPDMIVVPMIEIAPTIEVKGPNAKEIPFSLNNALQIGDQYILTGTIQQPASDGRIELIDVQVTDANGIQIPTQIPNLPDLPYFDWGTQFKVGIVNFPLELTFRWTTIAPLPDSHVEFEFDAGENPQSGQEWKLNQPIQIGGRTITLETVRVDSRGGYKFTFSSGPDVTGLSLQIPEYTAVGGGGGGAYGFGQFSVSQVYTDLPTGKLKIVLSDLLVASSPQTWTMQWAPENPPVSEPPVSTPVNGACLTVEKWNELVEQNDAPLTGLGSKLLTTVSEGGPLPAIYISNIDGTNLQKIAIGAWPSLSNDGTRLAYSAADGLHVIDLANGQNTAFGTDGYRIIWSPDNTRIMFTTTFNLYVVNADGSGLQTINIEPAQVISPVGWSSDNQTIFYSVLNGGGFDLKSYNLQSGEIKDMFKIHNKAGYGSISPDGQWIVFADRLSLDAANWSIFISRLDGSERKLIAEPEVPTAFTSVWGPDGQWLIVNTLIMDSLTKEQTKIPVLVNPFTCQAVRLNFEGMVEGWSR